MYSSHDANTLIAYKCIFLDLNLVTIYMIYVYLSIKYSSPVHLTAEKISQVDYVHTLCLARYNQVSIEGFSDEELNDMIKFISVD